MNIFKALTITSWDEETAAENNGNYDQNHSEKKRGLFIFVIPYLVPQLSASYSVFHLRFFPTRPDKE